MADATASKKPFLERVWCSLRNSASGVALGGLIGGTAGVLAGGSVVDALPGSDAVAEAASEFIAEVQSHATDVVNEAVKSGVIDSNKEGCVDTLRSGIKCAGEILDKDAIQRGLEYVQENGRAYVAVGTGAAGAAIGASEGAAFGAGTGWQDKLKFKLDQPPAQERTV